MKALVWASGLVLLAGVAGTTAAASALPPGTVHETSFEGGGARALALMVHPGPGRSDEIMVVRPRPAGDQVLVVQRVPGRFDAPFAERPIVGPRIGPHDHLVVFAERVATAAGQGVVYQVVRVFRDRAIVLAGQPQHVPVVPFGSVWVDGHSIEVSPAAGVGWFHAYTLTFVHGRLVRRRDRTLPRVLPPGFGRVSYTTVRYTARAGTGTIVRYAWLTVQPRHLTMYTGETLYIQDGDLTGGGVSVRLIGTSLKAIPAAVQGALAFQARRVGRSTFLIQLGGACACGVSGSRMAAITVRVRPPILPGNAPVRLVSAGAAAAADSP